MTTALAGFEHYLRLDPKDPYVRYQMGEIYLDRGDLAKAEQVFAEALATDPRVAQAKNALAVIAFRRGRLDEAERLSKEAIAGKSDVRLARYNLALIAEQRGDPGGGRASLPRGAQGTSRRAISPRSTCRASTTPPATVSSRSTPSVSRSTATRVSRKDTCSWPRHSWIRARISTRLSHWHRKALELKPRAELTPLGHFVLADLYNRVGRSQDAAREVAKGRALEARSKTTAH